MVKEREKEFAYPTWLKVAKRRMGDVWELLRLLAQRVGYDSAKAAHALEALARTDAMNANQNCSQSVRARSRHYPFRDSTRLVSMSQGKLFARKRDHF